MTAYSGVEEDRSASEPSDSSQCSTVDSTAIAGVCGQMESLNLASPHRIDCGTTNTATCTYPPIEALNLSPTSINDITTAVYDQN